MPRLIFLLLLFCNPMTLEAQVYRCDTPEGTIYSQMPCAENAERLPEYDPVVEPEATPTSDSSNGVDQSAAPEPRSAMENFIATLERQREQHFITLDANMQTLQDQLDVTGENAPNDRTREMLQRELAVLVDERASISEQYAALINEASNRAESK